VGQHFNSVCYSSVKCLVVSEELPTSLLLSEARLPSVGGILSLRRSVVGRRVSVRLEEWVGVAHGMSKAAAIGLVY